MKSAKSSIHTLYLSYLLSVCLYPIYMYLSFYYLLTIYLYDILFKCLSFFVSLCILYIYLSYLVYVCFLSIYLLLSTTQLSVCLPFCLSVSYISIYHYLLYICMSDSLFGHILPAYQYFYLFIHLCIYL